MPPCAALECERTGWTLERIPTDAPASAAARAARWPARPAPITRTSWSGMGAAAILFTRRLRAWRAGSGRRRGRLERPAHLVERHDAPEPALVVHGHDRAEPLEALRGEQALE